MAKGKPIPFAEPKAASVENPGAPIYFTLNSASGSKYYDWTDASPEAFSAARWQGKVPIFSYASFDGNVFSIATVRTDDGTKIDDFSILKK
jgi:acid phosphatase type 7